MKKVFCILLTLCMLCAAAPVISATNGVTVDATWSVLVPEEPTSYESFAADKLDGLPLARPGEELADHGRRRADAAVPLLPFGIAIPDAIGCAKHT